MKLGTSQMKWYVVHSKPRQEARAYENLLNQGFEVYLPTCKVQKLVKNKLLIETEPMFSRYLFIRLDDVTSNWFPIRSTRGVSKLLQFGKDSLPITVTDEIIELIKATETPVDLQIIVRKLFKPQSIVEIKSGPFKGLSGFYQQITSHESGEVRALLLIELLGKKQHIEIPLEDIQRH